MLGEDEGGEGGLGKCLARALWGTNFLFTDFTFKEIIRMYRFVK